MDGKTSVSAVPVVCENFPDVHAEHDDNPSSHSDNYDNDILNNMAGTHREPETGRYLSPTPVTQTNAQTASEIQLRLDHEYRMEMLRIKAETELAVAREREMTERIKIEKGIVPQQPSLPRSADHQIPPFDEATVPEFFRRFERMANAKQWPEQDWAHLITPVLKGKALKVYDSLEDDECFDYSILKSAVLRAYELRPETYRQRFRYCNKQPNTTYLDFRREILNNLEMWMQSENVNGDFRKLKELVALECFMSRVGTELRSYLLDKDVKTTFDAATFADDYAARHRSYSSKPKSNDNSQSKPNSSQPKNQPSNNPPAQGSKQNHSKTGNSSGDSQNKNTQHTHKNTRPPFSCTHCGKTGHTRDRCYQLTGANAKTVNHVSAHVLPCDPSLVPIVSGTHDDDGVPIVSPKGIPPSEDFSRVTSGEMSPGAGVVQAVTSVVPDDLFTPYLYKGLVKVDNHPFPVQILRDTGAKVSLWKRPPCFRADTTDYILLRGVFTPNSDPVPVPLITCVVECDIFQGVARVGVVDSLPEDGITFLLGNDLIQGLTPVVPVVSEVPVCEETTQVSDPALFPVCAVTRSMRRLGQDSEDTTPVRPEPLSDKLHGPSEGNTLVDSGEELCLSDVGAPDDSPKPIPVPLEEVDVVRLGVLQAGDPDVQKLKLSAVEDVKSEKGECFYMKSGILWRRWRPSRVPPDEGMWDVHQIVVPKECKHELLELSHNTPLSGHMGVRKTLRRLQSEFYWPHMSTDVANFVKQCHICQLTGTPNKPIPKSPLIPIPAFEPPFTRLIIDVVGPLPPTSSGQQYLLTILDPSTRFPEAVPLRSIKSKNIVKALLDFFSKFGLPREIQSDQGSNFLSNVFQQSLRELGVVHIKSSAYHPESQGAVERYHQTLKSMLRKYCLEHSRDWDKGLPFLLFATREVPQESLGFSPNELVFGHRVRGPLSLVKDVWSGDAEEPKNLLQYVLDFKSRLADTLTMAHDNLKAAQGKMKCWYDKKARLREFQVGDEVLVLLPLQGQPLAAKFSGPYTVEKRIGPTDYLIKTPDRRKTHQLCHVNMLKQYHRPPEAVPVHLVSAAPLIDDPPDNSPDVECNFEDCSWLGNEEAETTMKAKVSHLPPHQSTELLSLLASYPSVFSSVPGRTDLILHDVDVGNAEPIKLPPYRVSPRHAAQLRQELQSMLELGIITPCVSPWSSPVTLQPKSDGSIRFCIDYRKLNAVTKTDAYPLPRLEDCVDRIGASQYITKLDLKSGFWQVGLTERAKAVSCFVADGTTYQCNVMPYGMKNSPATFQRLMNMVVQGLDNCCVYLDDVVVFSDSWEHHFTILKNLLTRLNSANLVVNLKKCEFVCAQVQYLGYVVGLGKVRPPDSKVDALKDFPAPRNKRELRRFLGCIGYYRRFLKNFATVVFPLTELLKKESKYIWTDECENSFQQAKETLSNYPVMLAPNFDKPFALACDASNVGAGAVLLQEDDQGVEHPICFFSKKFNSAQKNYSVVEKELLALILAMQHFSVYVPPYGPCVKVYTDHHPLTYLRQLTTKNQRLTRWSLFLQQFNLNIKHIKGTDNVIADCLSRA